MSDKVLFTLFLLLVSMTARPQQRGIMAVGISGGVMNYHGDLDDDDALKFTRSGFGVHLMVLPNSIINYSVNFLHGRIAGDDAKADVTGNKFRNLNFYSDINELSFQALYRFRSRYADFTNRKKFIPYLFAGISVFHFNPKTKLDGKVYELQKIGTEGQYLADVPGYRYPSPYHLWQVGIPFGGGIKYSIGKRMDIGIETGFRPTFTDYLDDVSGKYPDKNKLLQEGGDIAYRLSDRSNDPNRPNGRNSFSNRGDASNNDWYIYSNINLTYYFTTKLFKGVPRF
jgi:hypothetical protein